ncbi:glutathione S-transferase [Exophiala viscosa]|uniref:Glutathione S-transferase n=1 Tax=Exophiala viscosa TaxID=2486360 RepID=A0AAN6E4M1_9EURO|nr:glutathione S-transferase [Exophiala viscosa]KAI1627129.1 glutathione S-transferase [Exophiala viscosa]
MDGPNNGIVLYHYSFSPYARRVLWYLSLRGIDYAECKQAPVLPRPDLNALGINYRRIPVLAVGRDIYCDSRLILRKLEELFPDGTLGASSGEQKAIERFLDVWATESGLFARASQLIPTDMPLLNDPKFTKDREDLTGRSWSKEQIAANRPEALAYIRNAFKFLETTLLADGRTWVLKTDKPTLADIEAVWTLDWLNGLKGALPRELISEKQYPKVFSWIARFNKALNEAKKQAPKPATLKGGAATQRVLNASFAEKDLTIDSADPLGLQHGTEVEVYPTDSGVKHHDKGRLLGLTEDEVVVSIQPQDKEVRVHYPRTGFRIKAVIGGSSKL